MEYLTPLTGSALHPSLCCLWVWWLFVAFSWARETVRSQLGVQWPSKWVNKLGRVYFCGWFFVRSAAGVVQCLDWAAVALIRRCIQNKLFRLIMFFTAQTKGPLHHRVVRSVACNVDWAIKWPQVICMYVCSYMFLCLLVEWNRMLTAWAVDFHVNGSDQNKFPSNV